jgi:hypothetical protein
VLHEQLLSGKVLYMNECFLKIKILIMNSSDSSRRNEFRKSMTTLGHKYKNIKGQGSQYD